ncbi:TPA: hypothetical protein N0F65_001848 [Lagenidium giganteum]|uniref:C3H1-type domain-containing protein n=1 Tax=Lagenidium giganteum TaxID=4803 RepID=A0AAV2YQN8_9STRA|nr:TPA: hypothetical protein N0F65_001848 [Lagenidium giganteum]
MQVLANGDIVDCHRLPVSARNNLYKTELCKHFTETGTCRYGAKCQFAHGEEELRGVLRHPKYKTTRCKAFLSTGKCMYGSRCRFIHTDYPEDDMSSMESLSSTASESDEHEQRDLLVNPYSDSLAPINLSLPFGGLKQVTLTPLTSINSSIASPPDFDAYLFRDPFAEFKLNLSDNDLLGSPSFDGGVSPPRSVGSDESVESKFSRLSIFQRICREEEMMKA